MSKMNYNRPNRGYEAESWRNPTANWDTKSYWQDLTKQQPKTFPEHQGHQIVLTKCKPTSVHAGAYRCVTCNRHLAWASKQQVLGTQYD